MSHNKSKSLSQSNFEPGVSIQVFMAEIGVQSPKFSSHAVRVKVTQK